MAKSDVDAVKEAKAIETCGKALSPLSKGGRKRVLDWLLDSFGSETTTRDSRSATPAPRAMSQRSASSTQRGADEGGEHSSFEELFEAAKLKTDVQRALVAAYWLQFRGDAGDASATGFSTAEANELLHTIGHRIKNVAMAFRNLRKKKQGQAAPVVQFVVKGSKKTSLRVTPAGKKRAETMLQGDGSAED